MSPSLTCTLCGTVNVVTAGRCIACGEALVSSDPLDGPTRPIELPAPVAAAAPSPVSAPVSAPVPAIAHAAPPEIPRAPSPPQQPRIAASATAASPAASSMVASATASVAAAPQSKTSSKTGVVEEDLDSSAKRKTLGTGVAPKPKASPATGSVVVQAAPPPPPSEARAPRTAEPDANERTDQSAPLDKKKDREDSDAHGRFVVRLLLPEGDKRLAEIGRDRVGLGSGLDELGLTGDPRMRPGEAWLYVKDGKLWVEPGEGSQGVFRRVTSEEKLVPGDVVLMGDIAAIFESVPEQPALDEGRMVVGGGSSTPCGRLVFLRKDGSPGPVHDLPTGKTILGRTDGHVNFPSDSRLSRRHVRFFASDEGVSVEDLDSRNGTYLRVRSRTSLDVGDALRLGSAGLQIRSRA